MSDQFSRSRYILGVDGLARLALARVAIFGIGGVGSFAAEAIARSGVGQIDLIDHDVVSVTNINRQLIALHSTIGQRKVDVMAQRIKDINPTATVATYPVFFSEENADLIDLTCCSYVIDAIDTVSSKLFLIETCQKLEVPIISCMGTGNKLDPTQLRVGDIYETSGCPLARVMRRELRKRSIPQLKVVYSTEPARKVLYPLKEEVGCRAVPGSVPFVPSVAGLFLAGTAIKDIIRGSNG
jgi:tRNA A37 threonylcarbamoyladenosine dehydratase